MKDHSQAAMNSTNLKLRNLLIALECLELEAPAKEIFLRSFDLTEKFFLEFGDIIEDLQTVKARLKAIDNILKDVIKMIRNLMKSLDKVKDKVELIFWEDQMKKLRNFVNIHTKAVRIYYAYLKNPNNPSSVEMENFLCYASAMLKGAGLDLKAFDRVEDDSDETEVSEVKGNDDENLDNVKETEDVTMMVEDKNELDGKLDDKSLVVEKVDGIPEASKKEIGDDLKEKVSLDNTNALEAAGNDEDELVDDPETTEAEASNLDDLKLPQLDLNASFAKDTHVKPETHPEDASEDIIGNHVDATKVVEVVGISEDLTPDAKSNHDITENDDDEDVGVNDEKSSLAVKESFAKVDEDTDDEVRGYKEISVSENDDQFNNEVNEDILDKVKDLAVDVRDNSKEILENPNKFTEAKVERNVVKLLFEGTFKENSEEILENLDKFPEPEIKVEEVGSDEANVLKPEPKIEANAVEPPLDNDLDESLDEGQEYNLEVDVKATKDNALRVAFAQKVVPVGIEKSAVDGSVAKEPDPDATAVNAGNLTPEVKTNVKAENEEHENLASLSQRTLELKTIALWEKLMYIRKVGHFQFDAIVVDKHEFDKEHNCVLAKVLVITTFIQPMDMPVNYFLLLYDVSRLDNFKLLLSFPWRPGDLLSWVCYNAMMFFVLVLQLLYVLKESKVCCVMTPTAACEKSDMEADDSELEQLEPKSDLPVFLLDVNTDQGQEEDVLVDEIASADTSMVDDLAFVMPRLFPRLVYLGQFTPLKIITPGTTYTVK